MSILKTDRWFKIPEIAQRHKEQIRLRNDLIQKKSYNYTIAAGRRSYKTERFLKRYAVSQALQNPKWQIHLGGPTRQQSKKIMWQDVKDLIHPVFIKKISESDLQIHLFNKTVINVIGLKEFRRSEGGICNLAIITEWQQCDPDVYSQTFQPMLNDTGGIWIGEGRPFGKNHLFDDFVKGENHEKGWGSYHWKSSEILTLDQIERAKKELSLNDYLREYDASFETEFGAPYHTFSKLNLIDNFEFNANLPVIVTCDFNATDKPMSWVIGQKQLINNFECEIWFKCFSIQYTNTETMCDILIDYLKELYQYSTYLELKFYGDFAGNQEKSNSSETDWEIIKRKTRNQFKSVETFLKPCRSIRNSIAATNARMKNVFSEIRQYIVYEDCKPLIWDFEKCQWKDNNRELSDKDPLRGHASRAVDYYNYYEHELTELEESRSGVYA